MSKIKDTTIDIKIVPSESIIIIGGEKNHTHSNLYSLNKSTYVNLRWIAYIGQIIAILIVQFYLTQNFFDYSIFYY